MAKYKCGIAFAESRGDEEVTNGTFDDDSDWIANAPWSIANGKATYDCTGASSDIRQDSITGLTIGSIYEIEYDIDSSAGDGSSRFYVADGSFVNQSDETYHVTGRYSVTAIAAATSSYFRIRAQGTTGTLDIDNVTVKEVTNLMNLNLDGTWADLTDSTAYDGTLGSGDISFGETSRNVRRYNETVYAKQKIKIDGLM